MSQHPHYDEIWEALQDLLSMGFRITGDIRDDQRVFGNAMVEVAADDLRVRFVYDRGQRLADISTDDVPEGADLKGALRQLKLDVDIGPWSHFKEAVRAVAEHRADLRGAIRPAREAARQYLLALQRDLESKDRAKK